MPLGRPRKSEALKELEGTARADRKSPLRPRVPIKIPKPPGDLNIWQRLAWVDLAKRVDPLQVVTDADLVAFRHTAIVLGILEQARKALDDCGSLTYEVSNTTGGSKFIARPEVDVIAKYERLLEGRLSRFGLIPAAGGKPADAPAGPAEVDPLDEFAVGSDDDAGFKPETAN